MIRTFIAIPLPESLSDPLCASIRSQDWGPSKISWVRPENIHITLRFMGEIKPKKVKLIHQGLAAWLAGTEAFRIQIGSLGYFGTTRHPQVIWAGLREGEMAVVQIYERLQEGLCRIGYPKQRDRFVPHITLGRIRRAIDTAVMMDTIQNFKTPPNLETLVDHVTFVESQLTSQGPVYSPISTVPLA